MTDSSIQLQCRACLSDSSRLMDILDFEYDLPSIIYNLTKIQINKDDPIPTMFCFDCVGQLIRIAKFQKMLIESDHTLTAKLLQNMSSKSEAINIEFIDAELVGTDSLEHFETNDETATNDEGNVVLLKIENALDADDNRVTNDLIRSQSEWRTEESDILRTADDQLDLDCHICGKTFPSAKSRRVHEFVHNLGQFKCKLCDRNLTTAGFLRVHMQNIHNVFIPKPQTIVGLSEATGTANCQCDICKLYFPRDRIGRHMRVHTRIKISKLRKCPFCPQTFSCLRNIQRHQKKCHNDQETNTPPTSEYDCNVCNQIFSRPIELYEHSKEHDADCVDTEDGFNLTCDHCPVNCDDYETFARHMVDVHHVKRVQPYKCRICSMRNGSRSALYMHINGHYSNSARSTARAAKLLSTKDEDKTNRKTFPCEYCSLHLKSARRLEEHTRVHTGEEPFECVECKKRFKSRMTLGKHIKSRHAIIREFSCIVCEKDFSTKYVLDQHMYTHTGERPFKCDQCDKSFAGRSRLKEHALIHTNLRPYPCDVCTKAFRSHTNLRHHRISMHSDQRNHLCTICGRAFKFNSTLQSHLWTHNTKQKPYNCDACKVGFMRLKKLKLHVCPVATAEKKSSEKK